MGLVVLRISSSCGKEPDEWRFFFFVLLCRIIVFMKSIQSGPQSLALILSPEATWKISVPLKAKFYRQPRVKG